MANKEHPVYADIPSIQPKVTDTPSPAELVDSSTMKPPAPLPLLTPTPPQRSRGRAQVPQLGSTKFYGDVEARPFGDPIVLKNLIYEKVLKAAEQLNTPSNSRYALKLKDVHYAESDHFPLKQQKEAILTNKTISRRLRGTWELSDTNTGDVIDQRKMTIAQVPHMNERGTFILNGSEYVHNHQLRLRPGVFTRIKSNDEIEAHVNTIPGKGVSHRYFFEPENSTFKINIGQSKVPLYPLLSAMGVTDQQVKDAWGSEIAAVNKQLDSPHVVNKLYDRIVRKPDNSLSLEDKKKALVHEFTKMEMDPEVTTRTLGKPYSRLTPEVILATTKKLLAVNRREQEPDDRDHLAYQILMGPEDLLAERIGKDRKSLNRLLWDATNKGNLDKVQPGIFTKALMASFISSGLGQAAEEVNAAELVDHQGRVTRLGEGGIPSVQAIPEESRSVHPSQLGFMDSVKTPETFKIDPNFPQYFMTKKGWIYCEDVTEQDEFACLIDGRLEFHKPLGVHIVPYKGLIYYADTKLMGYAVTPSHKMYIGMVRSEHNKPDKWRAKTAEDVHDTYARMKIGGHEPYLGTYSSSIVTLKDINDPVKDPKQRWISDLVINLDDYAELLGWFLSEGSILKSKIGYYRGICLTQHEKVNPAYYKDILELLNKLPFIYTALANKKTFNITDRRLGEEFSKFGTYSHNKIILEECFEWPVSARKRLFESMLKGDGSKTRRKKAFVSFDKLATNSLDLAKDFQRLAFSLGYSTVISNDPPHYKKDGTLYKQGYSVYIHSTNTRFLKPKYVTDKDANEPHYRVEHVHSLVSCVSLPGGMIFSKVGDRAGLWSFQSFKAGVDLRTAFGVKKTNDGNMIAPFRDVKTGKILNFRPQQIADMTVAFPGELKSNKPVVAAMAKGKLKYVPREQVDVELTSMENSFSPLTNMVPMKSAVKAQRASMGARMITQALPLQNPEAPYVQSGMSLPNQPPGSYSYEQLYGNYFGIVRAKDAGTVSAVSPHDMTVKYDNGKEETFQLYHNHPYNRRCLIGSTIVTICRKRGYVEKLQISDYEFKKGDLVASIDPITNKSAWLPISAYSKTLNEKKLFWIKTRSNREVVVTEDHSLVTLDQFGKLMPIYPKDCIAGKTRLPVSHVPEYQDIKTLDVPLNQLKDYGYLAGLYLAEGHHIPNSNVAINIAVKPLDRKQEVFDLANKLIDTKVSKQRGRIYISNPIFKQWLLKHFGCYSATKHIQSYILGWPTEFKKALISGYMGGDGSVWKDTNGSIQVTAATTSRKLRDDLVDLLSSIGISTTKFYKQENHRNPKHYDAFGFRIFSGHLAKFGDQNFKPEELFFYKDIHTRYLSIIKPKYRDSSYELIPINDQVSRSILYQEFKDQNLKVPAYIHKTALGGLVSKSKLKVLRGTYGNWANSDVFWDTIESITPVDSSNHKFVYDLEVEYSNVFAVNNGLVIHNTYLHNTPLRQVGDRVNKNTMLAKSNYTDDEGTSALGLNTRIAYTNFRGLTFEDAAVISKSYAKRLTSEHLYQHQAEFDDKSHTGKKAYISIFPSNYDKKLLDNIDDTGIIKPGTVVNFGDPLILSTKEKERTQNQVHRSNKPLFSDSSVTWEHHSPGMVTDVVQTNKGATVNVKSYMPMAQGDKLCWDPETELLTNTGWKSVADITLQDKIATLNEDGETFTYLNPAQIHEFDHKGKMYNVQTSQIDMLVTDNHKLYVKKRDKKNFELIEAKKLFGKRYNLKKTATWTEGHSPEYIEFPATTKPHSNLKAKRIDAITYAKVLGMYLSEGSLMKNSKGVTGFNIFQIKEDSKAKMLKVFNDANIHVYDHIRTTTFSTCSVLSISSVQWGKHLAQFGEDCYSKFLPDFVFEWNTDLQRHLLDFLLLGDGNIEANGRTRYYSTSKRLADDVQRLAFHLGYAANVSVKTEECEKFLWGKMRKLSTMYVVSLNRHRDEPLMNKIDKRHAKTSEKSDKWVDYEGKVHCVTMPRSNVVYTRRNGRAVWSGNSGRFGDKSIVAAIIDDHEMPHDEQGRPFELLTSPAGLISRINPAQLIEASLGKISEKTGKPYKIEDFSHIDNLTQYALDELKKHNLSDTETITDPLTGRKIPNVMTGNRFIMKLFHQAECFDDKTEVLTKRGWLLWEDTKANDQLATLEKDKLIFERPLKLIKEPYDNLMFYYKNKYIDYAVTPNHKLYIKRHNKNDKEYYFEEASQVHGQQAYILQFDETNTNLIPRKIGSSGFTYDYYVKNYKGMIYCAEMRTGLLYARRNNKPMISGNSKSQALGGGGAYTAEGAPSKSSGSKKISLNDGQALLAHGALEVLRDSHLVRGQQNTDYWIQFLSGRTPADPKTPFVYTKFINELKGSGINVKREGTKTHIMALTDKDIESLAANREIKNADTVDWKGDLKPKKGGLFDPGLTGGHGNEHTWSKISLHEPMPNPVMEEPIRRLLNLTENKYLDILSGKEHLNNQIGPKAILSALSNINITKELDQAKAEIRSGKKSLRDHAVRRLSYLTAAQKLDIHPKQWILHSIPVLPPAFRPISAMSGSKALFAGDANELYKEAFEANKMLKDMSSLTDDVSEERLNLYNSFKAITGLGDPIQPNSTQRGIKGILKHIFGSSPKFSTVQYKLLGTSVNMVGRGVIGPNPDMDMDHIGIPENKAWDIYQQFIIRGLVRNGMSKIAAMDAFQNRSKAAKDVMMKEMETRPVIANRYPILHRYGLMAFYPKLVKGDTIQTSPLVTKGFGADFDGDQQIGSIIVALNKSDFAVIISSSNVLDINFWRMGQMSYSRTILPIVDQTNYEYFHMNLQDVPHDITYAEKDHIKFHNVSLPLYVVAYDKATNKPVLAKISGWSEHKDRNVILVNLKSGRQIITDDDPRAVYALNPATYEIELFTPAVALEKKVFVPRVDKLLEQIYPDAVKHIDLPNHEKLKNAMDLNFNSGHMLGCLVGDGWVSIDGTSIKGVCFSCLNDDVLAQYKEDSLELFNEYPHMTRIDNGKYGLSYGESIKYTINNTKFGEWLLPLIGRKASGKHLPPFFLNTSREFRLGLLAGLIDTDGTICIAGNGGNKHRKKGQLLVNYTSKSLRLIQEIQHLLRSLNVKTSITKTETLAGEDFWCLNISSVDFYKLNLKVFHTDKVKALKDAPAPDENSGGAISQNMIPISTVLAKKIMDNCNKKDRTELTIYSAFSKAKKSNTISRYTANKILKLLEDRNVNIQHQHLDRFKAILKDTSTSWDQVESIDVTNKPETGYDLSVPGYETFMSVDGVILSNTMQYHVPVSDAAKQEALDKMLPSRNLLSGATFKVHYTPNQEYIQGLHAASIAKDSGTSKRTFASNQDAIKAYKRGEIDLGTTVEILEDLQNQKS